MSEPRTFVLSPGPHLHSATRTTTIMWWVNGTLAPALLWGVFVFGWRALAVVVAAVAGALAAEWGATRALGRKSTIRDGSAVCTGILLAFTLPPLVPWWMAMMGGAFSILVVKMMFGGLGFNLFNPALAGRAFMMATFPLAMTSAWAGPRAGFTTHLDAVTSATPLGVLKEHGLAAAMALVSAQGEPWSRMVLGFRPGSIGEVSVALIVLGGMVLTWRGIIGLTIPVSVVLGTVAVTAFSGAPGLHLLGGGLWLGAFYMATDYVTSPTTRRGRIAFGLVIGGLTGLIRMFGGYPEGICYAILIANAMVPAFNLWFRPARTALVGSPS
jgi:electron transport complex protein RnfD